MKVLFKGIAFTVLLVFFVMFLANFLGYYEGDYSRKSSLTNDAILEFEKRISEGEEIDLNSYIDIDNDDYDNMVSDVGLIVSNKIDNVVYDGIKFLFKELSRIVE